MTKAGTKTKPFDVADHLDDTETITAYLDEALHSGDPGDFAAALGDVARARGMTSVAKATGLSRESLYRALSVEGNPELATVIKALSALGWRLSVEAIAETD